MKYFRFTLHEIMWEVSYANLLMYLGTIPSYKKDGEEETDHKEIGMDQLFNMMNHGDTTGK